MAKPNIALLPAWASNQVFTTGPAIGLPTKIIIPAPVANEGHRPGAADPTGAEYWNDWLNQVYQWCVWVDEGRRGRPQMRRGRRPRGRRPRLLD